MQQKHLQNDQIIDCALDQIEGQMCEKECSCKSCSLRITRAKDITLSLRSLALDDIPDIPSENLFLATRKPKRQKRKKILYATTGLIAASFIAFVINITLIKKPALNTERQGQMFFSSGEVLVNGKIAETGYKAKEGDIFETKSRASAVIQFGHSGIVALREMTIIKITECNLNNDKPSIRIEQSSGITFNKIIKDSAVYSVRSLYALAAVKGTAFTFTANNRFSEIKLLHGEVLISRVTHPENNIILGQGNSISVDDKGISGIHTLAAKEARQLEILDKIEISQDKNFRALSPEVKRLLAGDLNPNSAASPMTLAQIQEKYGALNKIEMWNGKIYIGAFIREGSSALIVTPDGSFQISVDDVNKVFAYTLK